MVHRSTLLLTTLAALSYTGLAQCQAVAPYQILSTVIDMNGIEATFIFAPQATGGGARVLIEVQSGLSKLFAISPTGGFEYHIHVKPVGPNNDCMSTGGHLDPGNIGAARCNPAKPEKCQEGDLSGKHGELQGTESGAIPVIFYEDRLLQFTGESATIAGRSVVIHNNGTRVACGDILRVAAQRVPSGTNSANKLSSSGDQITGAGSDAQASSYANGASSRVVGGGAAMTTAGALAAGILGAMLGL